MGYGKVLHRNIRVTNIEGIIKLKIISLQPLINKNKRLSWLLKKINTSEEF